MAPSPKECSCTGLIAGMAAVIVLLVLLLFISGMINIIIICFLRHKQMLQPDSLKNLGYVKPKHSCTIISNSVQYLRHPSIVSLYNTCTNSCIHYTVCSQYSQQSPLDDGHGVTWSDTKGVDIDMTSCEAYEVTKRRDLSRSRNKNEGTQETAAVYEELP